MNQGIKFGAISGVVISVYSLILNMAGQSLNPLLGNLGLIILIVFIVLAHLATRKDGGGVMGYGKALGVGVVVTVVSALISQIYAYIQMKFISPELPAQIADMQAAAMEQQGMSQEQIDMAMNSPFLSAGGMAVMAFIMTVIVGIILCLIISAFTKKSAQTT